MPAKAEMKGQDWNTVTFATPSKPVKQAEAVKHARQVRGCAVPTFLATSSEGSRFLTDMNGDTYVEITQARFLQLCDEVRHLQSVAESNPD